MAGEVCLSFIDHSNYTSYINVKLFLLVTAHVCRVFYVVKEQKHLQTFISYGLQGPIFDLMFTLVVLNFHVLLMNGFLPLEVAWSLTQYMYMYISH